MFRAPFPLRHPPSPHSPHIFFSRRLKLRVQNAGNHISMSSANMKKFLAFKMLRFKYQKNLSSKISTHIRLE